MRACLAALLLVFMLPAFAQQEVEDAKRTVAAIENLLKQRPNDATLWFYLARFQSMAGDVGAATRALQRVEELGEGYLPVQKDFARAWGDTSFQEVRSRMEARLPRLDYAPTAFTIEDRGLASEGIAYDRASRSFFMGGGPRRKILRVMDDGRVTDFAATVPQMDAVLGMAVDAPRRIVYVVSTSALTPEGRAQRRNAVYAFDIDSRKQLQRYDVPGAVQLNDVTVAAGGRVFASDSASGSVWELPVKGPGPARELFKGGPILGTNGLAATADGRRLYLAHSTGLAVLDIAGGTLKRLENRTRESVAGIDGLYAWQGELVAVQNVTNPGRVIRIQLSPDGEAVVAVKTLLSHHHNALDQPTTLAVADDGFYLLAATGIAYLAVENPDPSRLTVVRIPLPR